MIKGNYVLIYMYMYIKCFCDLHVHCKLSSYYLNVFSIFGRLTFQFNPSSKVYGYLSYDLKPDGENVVRYIFLIVTF